VAAKDQILCVGTDPLLLKTREWILSRRFAVTLATGPVALGEVPLDLQVDLVILCYTMSDEQYDEALAIVSRRWPKANILTLRSPAPSGTQASDDHAFDPFRGPEALLATISELLDAKAEA
jgi:hypothetical protein